MNVVAVLPCGPHFFTGCSGEPGEIICPSCVDRFVVIQFYASGWEKYTAIAHKHLQVQSTSVYECCRIHQTTQERIKRFPEFAAFGKGARDTFLGAVAADEDFKFRA